MAFNIIENTLATRENGVLIIENDVYRLKMRYIGNYAEDLKNHTLSTDFLTINNKIKKYKSVYMPTLACVHGVAMLNIDVGIGLFNERSMRNMIDDFALAQKCLADFQSIITQYFPTE